MKNKNHDPYDMNDWTNRMIKKKYIVWIVLLACSFLCSSAQTISVKASVNKNKILIGEPILLQLEAVLPMETNAKWFPVDSIPHFEFIEQAKIDTAKNRDVKSFKQILTITSFDSGRWIIPALALDVGGRYYLTDSLTVSVAFSNFDPSQEYHDIKDILDVSNADIKYVNWAIAAITLLSLAAVIYFLRKRMVVASKPVGLPESKLSPFDEAIQSLEQLKKQQLPENGQVKLYYTRLNDILRSFIGRRMTVITMQKTNEELMLQVRQLGLQTETFILLAQTLRLSDAVKFAKFVPGNEDNEQSFRSIKTSIELLNNLQT